MVHLNDDEYGSTDEEDPGLVSILHLRSACYSLQLVNLVVSIWNAPKVSNLFIDIFELHIIQGCNLSTVKIPVFTVSVNVAFVFYTYIGLLGCGFVDVHPTQMLYWSTH